MTNKSAKIDHTFERLMADPDNIEDNFKDYLNGFSENVRDIIEKFKFDGHIATMVEILELEKELSGSLEEVFR